MRAICTLSILDQKIISLQSASKLLPQRQYLHLNYNHARVFSLRNQVGKQKRHSFPVTATISTAAASVAPKLLLQIPIFSGGWGLWACIAACAALSQAIERRTKIGIYLSAPLLATFLALAAAAVGIIPSSSHAVYDTIWTFVMPLAAALYLLESDISELMTSAGQSILAFFNGALGTVLGTVAAFALVGKYLPGADGAKVAAALCASYIGGSVNFAAVSGLLGLSSGATLAAAMTADNLAMAAYIAIIMSIPAQLPPSEPTLLSDKREELKIATGETVSLALAAGIISCGLGSALSTWSGFQSGGLAFTALIATAIATLAGFLRRRFLSSSSSSSSSVSPFTGSEALGSALMMLFFATIGAVAGSLSALRGSGWLLIFIAIQLSIQLGVSLFLGRLCRIPMPIILIAANANVGGPATAAAMAGAKGWKTLVQPAVLTGALGYAIANGIGWAMGTWFLTWKFI